MTVADAFALIPALVPWHDGAAVMRKMPAPAGWTGSRWQQACLDATELLALGWSAIDLFGLHLQAPGSMDCFGLALLLDGGTVAELIGTVAELIGDGTVFLRTSGLGSRCGVDHGSQRCRRGR